jgi:hypothetical protein
MLTKVRGDYGIGQKEGLNQLTPSLKRNIVKKVLWIGLGLSFLPGKKKDSKFRDQGPHAFSTRPLEGSASTVW